MTPSAGGCPPPAKGFPLLAFGTAFLRGVLSCCGCPQTHGRLFDPRKVRSLRMQADSSNFEEQRSRMFLILSSSIIVCAKIWSTEKPVQYTGLRQELRTSLKSRGNWICYSCSDDCYCIVVNAPLGKMSVS